jgi:HSP20 family molecular chaperone IbpA
MMKPKWTQDPNPWETMNQFFNEGFPFTGISLPTDSMMVDPAWIEKIVQSAFTQSMPSQDKELYTHKIFETHKSVVVRIRLPRSIDPGLLRVYVGSTSLRVEGLPNHSDKKIQLPCEVNKVGIRASFKDEILEIRMAKKRSSEPERQISISIL